MLPKSEMLQYIYKTTDMGCEGIDTVTKHAAGSLKEELLRERAQYEKLKTDSAQMMKENGDTPGGVSKISKWSAEMMSAGKLAMDDSAECIAEMLIQGTTMGVIKTIRHLNDLEDKTGPIRRLGERLLDVQQENIEKMKNYL